MTKGTNVVKFIPNANDLHKLSYYQLSSTQSSTLTSRNFQGNMQRTEGYTRSNIFKLQTIRQVLE